jgi:hypothetical protein
VKEILDISRQLAEFSGDKCKGEEENVYVK